MSKKLPNSDFRRLWQLQLKLITWQKMLRQSLDRHKPVDYINARIRQLKNDISHEKDRLAKRRQRSDYSVKFGES